MSDLFEKITKNLGPLGMHAKEAHGYFTFPKLEGEISTHMGFRGKTMLNWSLNNYLGLANHPEVRKTDAEAAQKYGLALPMGARMMSGNSENHEELERQLSEFVEKDDTFLLNFGYQGIMSAIDAIVGRHDVIVYDAESHACIIDGVRMHQGKRFAYTHNDMEKLETCLLRAENLVKETGGGILVITEGVFGMRGDLGRLDEVVALKKKFNFRLLVDDAHGFGTMGKTGAGSGEHFGIQDQIDLYFSTFAKSMAGIGAFISGPRDIINFLRYNMRSQIFAKALPMPLVVGMMKRLELLRTHPELKSRLWTIVNALQTGLKERGLEIGNTESPVTPVYLSGSIPEATHLVHDLRENYNIFCSMVTYPVIPKGMIILRLIPTAAHTLEDVKQTLDAFTEVARKLGQGAYKSDKLVEGVAQEL